MTMHGQNNDTTFGQRRTVCLSRRHFRLPCPAHNEADGLAEAVRVIGSDVETLGPVEVILVDDGSTDATWAVTEDIARADDRVQGIRLSRDFGKEGAYA